MVRSRDIVGGLEMEQVLLVDLWVQTVPFELEGGSIDQGFEYRPELSLGIHRSVEIAVMEPTHHGFDHAIPEHNNTPVQFRDL